MWGSGNYAAVADKISAVGEHIVEAVGLAPGMDVLDVACGSGNATIPAARAGARVTGVDFSPELLAIAPPGRQTRRISAATRPWSG